MQCISSQWNIKSHADNEAHIWGLGFALYIRVTINVANKNLRIGISMNIQGSILCARGSIEETERECKIREEECQA